MQWKNKQWKTVKDGYEFYFCLEGYGYKESVVIRLPLDDLRVDVLFKISPSLEKWMNRQSNSLKPWSLEECVQALMVEVTEELKRTHTMSKEQTRQVVQELIEPIVKTHPIEEVGLTSYLVRVLRFEAGSVWQV